MRAVVVTGASTGIGRACALHLAARDWRVFAGVRKEADADALRAEDERIEPLILDVTDEGAIAAAAERVGEAVEGEGLAGLVNNAGIAVPGPLEGLPLDQLRRQLEVNLIAQVAVTQAFLPQLRAARGRIVFMTSIGGRVAFPFNGPYHASKHGLEAIGDCLRQELRPWGIEVAIVEPGSIATKIWERGEANAEAVLSELSEDHRTMYAKQIEAMKKATAETGKRGIPPERVAKTVEHALSARRPKTRYVVGADARGMLAATSILPTRVWDRIVARQAGLGG